jgi:SnoaL-like domain
MAVMRSPAGWRSLGQPEERLAFLDDIGGEDRPGAAADVPHRVNRSSWDGQGVTGVKRPRRLAFDLILQRPVKDIDDLFTRMSVLDCWRVRVDVDARLNDLTPGGRRIEGREAFKKWAEEFSAAIGNFDSEIVDSFENRDGSRVAATFRITGTNNGAFGTKPDGSPVEMTGIVISAVRDDGMLLSNQVERSAFETYQRLTAH